VPVKKGPFREPGPLALLKDLRQLLDELLSRLIKEALRKLRELILLVS